MVAITTIIFDFGGVLIEWDPRNLYRHFFASPVEMEHFLAEIGFAEWNSLQDKGRPFSEGVAVLSAQFPQYAHLIRAYHERWEESLGEPIAGTIKILQRLKALHYSVYGLSNWSSETFPITRARYPYFDLLDGYLISGEVKLLKPDPAIFHLLLDRIGRMAWECLYIDDHWPNIETAKRLGFTCIHFRSPIELENQLKQLGLL